MANQLALYIADIPWLRQASRNAGVTDMPHLIANKLLAGGYVEHAPKGDSLVITNRGRIALTRLG